jgi:glycerol-3-phosphate acyltransferase PlsY
LPGAVRKEAINKIYRALKQTGLIRNQFCCALFWSPESPMPPVLQHVLLLLVAYFLGTIPFGILFARLFGASDVRKAGSGNIGATNVARVAGPIHGILTLLADTAKGALAVWLAAYATQSASEWMMLAGIAALLGHCFPVWLRFKGGKGVATALGVFAVLCPLAISAAAAMPLLIYSLWAPGHAPPLPVIFGTLFASALVIYKHDANLQRLVEGTEPRISSEKSKGTAS